MITMANQKERIHVELYPMLSVIAARSDNTLTFYRLRFGVIVTARIHFERNLNIPVTCCVYTKTVTLKLTQSPVSET